MLAALVRQVFRASWDLPASMAILAMRDRLVQPDQLAPSALPVLWDHEGLRVLMVKMAKKDPLGRWDCPAPLAQPVPKAPKAFPDLMVTTVIRGH